MNNNNNGNFQPNGGAYPQGHYPQGQYPQSQPGYFYTVPGAPYPFPAPGARRENAFLSIVKGILYILLYMGMQVLLSVGLIFYEIFGDGAFSEKFFADPMGMQGELMQKVAGDLEGQYVMMIIAAAITVAILVIIQVVRKKKLTEEFHLKKIKPSVAILAFCTGFALNFGVTFILNFFPQDLMEEYTENMTYTGGILVYILAAVISAPLIEELIFRNFAQTRFNRAMPAAGAIILSAVCFGIAHMNLVQGLYAGTLGVFLGFAFARTKSVYTSILVHFGFNAVSIIGVVVEKLELSEAAEMIVNYVYYGFSVICLIVSVFLIILFFKLTSDKTKEALSNAGTPFAGTPYYVIPGQNGGQYLYYQPPVQNGGQHPYYQYPGQNAGQYPYYQPPVQNAGQYPYYQYPGQPVQPQQPVPPRYQPPAAPEMPKAPKVQETPETPNKPETPDEPVESDGNSPDDPE